MNLSKPFIERPIATSLLMGAIALFAWVGTAAAQSSPQSGYDQQYNGTVGGWGNTTVGTHDV